MDRLEAVLRIPYTLTPAWLKLDPTFDPIRKSPRFQRLLEAGTTTRSARQCRSKRSAGITCCNSYFPELW
jgi:hypothetical protein